MKDMNETLGRLSVLRRRVRMLEAELEELAPEHVHIAVGSPDVLRLWVSPMNLLGELYDQLLELDQFLASAVAEEWPQT